MTRLGPTSVAGTAALTSALGTIWGRLESPDSRRGYRSDWKRFESYCRAESLDVLDVTPKEVQRYVDGMQARGSAKATRARALAVLRKMYRGLIQEGILETNPAREVENPRVSNEPRTPWLGVAELRRLTQAWAYDSSWRGARNRLVLLFLVFTALRRSEVARLTLNKVEFDGDGGALVRVRVKGGKPGQIPLPGVVSAALRTWAETGRIQATGPVFPRAYGSRSAITGGTVWAIVKAAAKATGVDVKRATPHALRRTFATLALGANAPPADVQAAMLHRRFETTQLYNKASGIAKSAPGEFIEALLREKS